MTQPSVCRKKGNIPDQRAGEDQSLNPNTEKFNILLITNNYAMCLVAVSLLDSKVVFFLQFDRDPKLGCFY